MAVVTIDQNTRQVFEAIDARQAGRFASFFAEDARFRFGNAEPVVGRGGVEQVVGSFFASLGGVRHDITGIWTGTWEEGEVTSVEADVTYTRQDGSRTPPLPATSTLRWKGDQIQDYRIFIDLTPLFQ